MGSILNKSVLDSKDYNDPGSVLYRGVLEDGATFRQDNFSENNLSKSKNSEILYFGRNDDKDSIELKFATNLKLKENTIAVINHGNVQQLWDRSGRYSGGRDFPISSAYILHHYLYEWCLIYKKAINKNNHLNVLLYYCNSNDFAQQLSEMNPELSVIGVEGMYLANTNGQISGILGLDGRHGWMHVYREGIARLSYRDMNSYNKDYSNN